MVSEICGYERPIPVSQQDPFGLVPMVNQIHSYLLWITPPIRDYTFR